MPQPVWLDTSSGTWIICGNYSNYISWHARSAKTKKTHVYSIESRLPSCKDIAAYPHTFSPWNTIPVVGSRRYCAPSSPKLWLRSLQHALSLMIRRPDMRGHQTLGFKWNVSAEKGELKGESVKDRSTVKISQSHGPASFLNVPLSLTVCIQPEQQRSLFSASSSPAQWCQWTPSWVLISSETTRTHMTS